MFWKRKKKSSCKHEWHYVTNDVIYSYIGGCVDSKDTCWIVCVNCEKEKLVDVNEWKHIEKRQEILKLHNKKDEGMYL